MAQIRGCQRTILLIGHFPPPVHGMAVAMDALGDLLATQGRVVRLRTVPKHRMPGHVYHLSRICRVAWVLTKLVMMRRESSVAVLSVDAGHGMIYPIILSRVARAFHYSISLDHHSYAYISQPAARMGALVSAAGPSATHIFKCELARREFKRIYTRVGRTRVLSGAYALSDPGYLDKRGTLTGRPLTLGHLSNISMEKGLGDVVRLGREAVGNGLADKVVVAGRAATAVERELIKNASAAGYLEYRGSLSPAEKEAFFRDVDVFVFPSRYVNELAPAVVWEALLRGVPVIAYRAGCLTQEALGPGCVVVEPSADFVRMAVHQLRAWVRSPSEFAQARADSIRQASAERIHSIAEVKRTGQRLFSRRH